MDSESWQYDNQDCGGQKYWHPFRAIPYFFTIIEVSLPIKLKYSELLNEKIDL